MMKQKFKSILFAIILSVNLFYLFGCIKGNDKIEQNSTDANYPIPVGTFIQEHLVVNWSDQQWQEELKALHEVGMEYIVFGPALHIGRDGKMRGLYPTELTGNQNNKFSDLIENCLRNAQKAGFKVFLGLNFDERWWSADGDEAWLLDQMELGNRIADELIENYKDKYGNTMYGWYWVWEVANINELSQQKYRDALVNALNTNLNHLHSVTPDMPFMLCPFMNYRIGNAEEYAESWDYIFERTNFRSGDIFAPQDCVGAGGLKLEMIPKWFEELGRVVKKKPGLLFWSDAETFDQRYWTSAPLNRFVEQLNLTAPHVQKVITFAYSHYYSPNVVNSSFHKAYLHYVENGELPEIPTPESVSEAYGKITLNEVSLKWQAPSDISTIVGFNIYRNGEIIESIQVDKNNKFSSDYTDVNDSEDASCLYEISTFNAIGIESVKSKVHFN